jgi:hypothetical protein
MRRMGSGGRTCRWTTPMLDPTPILLVLALAIIVSTFRDPPAFP